MMRIRTLTTAVVMLGGILAGSAGGAVARDLAVDADDLVAVELATIAVEPMTGTPVVLLREPEAGGVVPIYIGPTEARAIILAQRGIELERPMTHDLAVSIIDSLGAKLERIVVDELRDGTYLGALEFRVDEDASLIRVDTRPSDGLALAVRVGAAIAVSPAVLRAGEDIPYSGLESDEEVITALGITVMAPSEDLRSALELPDEPGVIVTATRSIAALAGVQPGAMILAVNESPVATPMEYLEAINATESGEKAQIRFWFNGETRDIELSTEVPDASREQQRRL